MRIGVYGGTFNPIHRGHLTAALAAKRALELDKLLLIPASTPPHKALPEGSASPEQRMEMTVLATAELGPWAEVLDLELRRDGPSYTYDTLCSLQELYPEDELWLLMGTDMFLSLPSWHRGGELMRMVRIGAFDRTLPQHGDQLEAQQRLLEAEYGARIRLIENPGVIDISSTQLRQALREGRGEAYLPRAVYGYILREGLYGTHPELKGLSPDRLRPIALSYLKPKRMPHVLGTEEEAVRLARQCGADETKARIAALLHDCTKKLEPEEQLALCRRYGIELDEVERQAPNLLHAKTGAGLAREVFGVEDEVYWAIYWHTTGHADMTPLEKVLYLADYIEPSRDFPGVEELRRAVHADLDQGLLQALNDSIRENTRKGRPVHHSSADARDYLLRGKKL